MDTVRTIDEFHRHEVLDRIHLILCMIEDHVMNHPLTEENKELSEMLMNVSSNLAECYSYVGKLHIKRSKVY